MKNISVSVGGVNVAFNDDGTMRYISMKVMNMDEDHRWQEVLIFTWTQLFSNMFQLNYVVKF